MEFESEWPRARGLEKAEQLDYLSKGASIHIIMPSQAQNIPSFVLHHVFALVFYFGARSLELKMEER